MLGNDEKKQFLNAIRTANIAQYSEILDARIGEEGRESKVLVDLSKDSRFQQEALKAVQEGRQELEKSSVLPGLGSC